MSDRWGKYVGIPFVDFGRAPSGVDCWGLVLMVYALEFGVLLIDYDISGETAGDEKVADAVDQERPSYKRIKVPVAPCIVTMRNSEDPGIVNHVGVYVGNGTFLHTLKEHGSVRSKIDHPLWKHRIEGYYVPK